MHIRSRFQYTPGNNEEIADAVRQWRTMLREEMPSSLGKQIGLMSDGKMRQVMDMMKVRLRYMSDIRNHSYLWKEPDYNTELGTKF